MTPSKRITWPQKLTPTSARQGLRLFNRQEFYAAHEYFETAWRETPAPERELYRAFLQIAGGFYRLEQEDLSAARKFFTHAQGWLAILPESLCGVDIAQLQSDLASLLSDIDQRQPAVQILLCHFRPIFPQGEDQ